VQLWLVLIDFMTNSAAYYAVCIVPCVTSRCQLLMLWVLQTWQAGERAGEKAAGTDVRTTLWSEDLVHTTVEGVAVVKCA
jgi:hypothetical protein